MKKLAYTLAEALIAMAIIGVLAAIMLPMINKFMPDGNKALYLKTYDSLVETTQALVANVELYPILNNGDTTVYKNYPLYNTNSKITIDGTSYGGSVAKYCQLLATSFGDVPTNCSTSAPPAEPNWINNNISFTAPNGVAFMIYTDSAIEGANIRYKSDVYIDVDGLSKGPNCSYNANSCPQPDRFKFEVSSDGKVIASDIKGQEYLATRSHLRLYKEDDVRSSLGLTTAHLSADDLNKPLEELPNDTGNNDEGTGNSGEDESTGTGNNDNDNSGNDDDGIHYIDEPILQPIKYPYQCSICGTPLENGRSQKCPSCNHLLIGIEETDSKLFEDNINSNDDKWKESYKGMVVKNSLSH